MSRLILQRIGPRTMAEARVGSNINTGASPRTVLCRLPAYSAVEIGDCEKGKGKAETSPMKALCAGVSSFETGGPSTPGNRMISPAYTSCDNGITCLPGASFTRVTSARIRCAAYSPYYEDGVRQSHDEYHELTQQSNRDVSEFAAFSCGPTALEFDVAESSLSNSCLLFHAPQPLRLCHRL